MRRVLSLVLLVFSASGCRFEREESRDTAVTTAPPQPPAQAAPPPSTIVDSLRDLRFVVDLSERELYVLRGTDTLRTEAVAVGTREHPTPTGEWGIKRVDFNPDWTPPPGEDWTEDKEPQPPGAPDNPMGRARLVFAEPYSIHGTKERASLGKAESHGSIRVANEAAIELARLVMGAGGAARPESFFQQAAADRTVMHRVEIPSPVPITIQD